MAGVGRAIRKDSLPLAREMCSEGVLAGVRRADVLEALARGGRAVVLEVLSGGVPSRERTAKQSSLHGVYLQEE